jgi:hypothetical protein
MSFLKRLFGGGSAEARAPDLKNARTQEHDGFTIAATPYKENGMYQLCGVIAKEIGGERKEHRFVRADRFSGYDEAVDMTFVKGRQIIDQRRGEWVG